MTNWPCMMVVQWHLQWLENIVIPHHQTSSQQAMRSMFIFIQVLPTQILDSNLCTIQQVINTNYVFVQPNPFITFQKIHIVFKKSNTSILFFFWDHSKLLSKWICYSLKALLFSNDQKRIRGARKMNLFTILVELWHYDSRNLCSKKGSFSEHLYGQC